MAEEKQPINKIEEKLMKILRENPEVMKFFIEHPDYLREIVKSYEEKKEMLASGILDKGNIFKKDKDLIARMAEEV